MEQVKQAEEIKAKQIFITKPTKLIKDLFSKKFGGITFVELAIFAVWFVTAITCVLLVYFLISNVIIK
jgi:hypothetical protein